MTSGLVHVSVSNLLRIHLVGVTLRRYEWRWDRVQIRRFGAAEDLADDLEPIDRRSHLPFVRHGPDGGLRGDEDLVERHLARLAEVPRGDGQAVGRRSRTRPAIADRGSRHRHDERHQPLDRPRKSGPASPASWHRGIVAFTAGRI